LSDTPDEPAGPPDFQALAAEAAAAAERTPNDEAVSLDAAEMFLRAGDISRAVAFARNAVAASPRSFRAMRTLSGMLDAAGDRSEAICAAIEAVGLDPANAEVRLHLGGMMAAEQRWREAADHLSIHVVSAAATAGGWRLLSSVLHQAGSGERACEAARQALSADPGNLEYRLNLASLLGARGRYDEALDELQAALAQAPDDALVWRSLSAVHAALGELGAALRAAEHAVVLAPDDADGNANLAHVARLCAVPVAHDGARWSLSTRRTITAFAPPRPNTLNGDIAIRWRVIYAIMLRDIRTRFGHTRIGYLWAIMEPISHLLTLGVVFYELNRGPPPVGDNLFLFYITGLIPFLMFSHVSHHVMQAADANNAMLQLPVIKRTDIMVAQGLRQVATELCVGLIIFSIAGLLGQSRAPADLLTTIAAAASMGLLAIGVGAINLVISSVFHSYETFYAALIRLLYFGSGIYYSPIAMPDWVREWLEWNPILQGIEFFRSGFYPQYEPHWLDVNYLMIWVVGTVGIGFAMERAMRAPGAMPA
jgi:ABC-type polysaccharide/polyol phosphate export permease/Flp pilus assembly protein TadD